jgi:hypothetical protein
VFAYTETFFLVIVNGGGRAGRRLERGIVAAAPRHGGTPGGAIRDHRYRWE